MLKIETGDKNKILRTVSEDVKSFEIDKYSKLGKEMLKYIKNPENGGIGLAAPQVGYNKRVIAVGLIPNWDYEGSFPYLFMINPVIEEHSEETKIYNEGCLSVPGVSGSVKRWKDIKVTYLDEKAKLNTLKLSGIPAEVVQHEVDHLNGILFTDKLINRPKL